MLGQSDYTAHAGCYTGGANAVYWVNIVAQRPDGLVVVSNITEGAKRKVESVQSAIEPDSLYPLLRGRDVRRWKAEPSAHILVTHLQGMRLNAIPENEMKVSCPKTYMYLKRFEGLLRERAAFKRYFTRKDKSARIIETGPFYSMFNVGDYTFAPYKVVWREVANTLDAGVACPYNGKETLPDHTLILVQCAEKEEAHFLCSALNSSPAKFAVRAYIVLHPDPHILTHVHIPKFDPDDKLHLHLAKLSKEAHEAAKNDDQQTLQNIEEEIDEVSTKIWELSSEELREIKLCLKEMSE